MNETTQNILKKAVNITKDFYHKSPTIFAFLLGVGVGLFIAFIF